MRNQFIKEVAEQYVGPLLSEGILSVTKDHIHVMGLTIRRDRVPYFHIALSQIRAETPFTQSERGFTVKPVDLAVGNDIQHGYKIISNDEDKGEILLTRKLACELWEVILAFNVDKTPTDKVG